MKEAIVFESLNYYYTSDFFKLIKFDEVNIYCNKDTLDGDSLDDGLSVFENINLQSETNFINKNTSVFSKLVFEHNERKIVYENKNFNPNDNNNFHYLKFPFYVLSSQSSPRILQYAKDYSRCFKFIKKDLKYCNVNCEYDRYNRVSDILNDIYRTYFSDVMTTYVVYFHNNKLCLDIHLGVTYRHTFVDFLKYIYQERNINLLSLPNYPDLYNIKDKDVENFMDNYLNCSLKDIESSYKNMFRSIYYLLSPKPNTEIFQPIPDILKLLI